MSDGADSAAQTAEQLLLRACDDGVGVLETPTDGLDGPWCDLLGIAALLRRDPQQAERAAVALAGGDHVGVARPERLRTWALSLAGEGATLQAQLVRAGEHWSEALTDCPEDSPLRPVLQVRSSIAYHRRGDLLEAMALLREAHGAATRSGDRALADVAATMLADLALRAGRIAWAEHLARELVGGAVEAPARGVVALGASPLRVWAWAVLGRLAALRGRWDDAEEAFDAGAAAVTPDTAWACAAFAAERAMALATASRHHAAVVLAEADACLARADTVPDLARTWWVAKGRALGRLDVPDEAMAAFAAARDGWASTFDVAVVRLHEGEVLLGAGRPDAARKPLEQAADVFARATAPYWLARAFMALAEADPDRCEELLARARVLDDGDAAFDALGRSDDRLCIRLVDPVGVEVAGQVADFEGRQAEFIVLALAAVGCPGLSTSWLVEVLWPSPDPTRLPQRLRTLCWQIRRTLGQHAWRFERTGDRLRLDTRGVDVVLPLDEDGAVAVDDLLPTWPHLGAAAVQSLRERVAALEREADISDPSAA